MATNWNKNKGIRVSILESNQVDINIVGFSKEKNDKDSPEIDKSSDTYYTMRYILDGSGYAIINGKREELTRNTLLVSFPHSKMKLKQSEDNPYTIAWFAFNGLKAEHWLSQINITPETPLLYLPENKKLRALFTKTPDLCFSSPEYSDLYALSSFYQIVLELSLFLPSKQTDMKQKQMKEIHVLNAINYINQHYSDSDLSSSVVAQYLYLNPRYFSGIFKKVTGNTFSQYLHNKRIAAANSLMAQGETNISEIALKVGFNSPYYFTNIYKRYNKDNPKAHLKTLKKS